MSQLQRSLRESVADRLRPTPYDVDPSRSYLPYMRFLSRTGGTAQVSRAALAASGTEDTTAADSLRSDGDRIKDENNDGIPDHLNVVQGTGDTFRVQSVGSGTFQDLAKRYDEQREKEKEAADKKAESRRRADSNILGVDAKGVANTLKDFITGQAKKALGAGSTYELSTGRDVYSGNIRTGSPVIDAIAVAGSKAYDKITTPKIEEAAARSALGQEGYGIFTLGKGVVAAMTPDGIIGNIDNFLNITGRTKEQLSNEMADKIAAGEAGGHLRGLYQDYITPVTPTSSVTDIKGRFFYEETVLGSSLSDDLKSELLGGADLRPTIDYTFAFEDGTYGSGTTTGFAGRNRFDASTGQVVKDNTPSGPYRDTYETYTTDNTYFSDNMFDEGYSQFNIPSAPADVPTTTPTYTTTTNYDYSGQYDDNDSAGSSSPGPGSDFGSYDSSYDSIWAEGGHVRMKEEAKSDDPIQGTGFVSGPPNQYTKKETVADTEYRKVKEGSFVLNAPTVEKLMEQGTLPKGLDKSRKKSKIKAGKGGLIDVALSKGEIVLAPEDAKKIGYNFLNKLNDTGKAEVSRRQRNS